MTRRLISWQPNLNRVKAKPTFDAGHLFATGLVEERQLARHRIEHLDKVRQKEDDLHFVVGQVTTAADALRALNMGSTQQRHGRALM